MTTYIEFSYPIDIADFVQDDGINPPNIIARSRISQGNHSNTSYVNLFLHLGTHIDAPWHFFENGLGITDIPIENFVYNNVTFLNINKIDGSPIMADDLEIHKTIIENSDCLILYSGFSKFRDSQKKYYIEETPGLSVGAAQFLADFPLLKCVAVDFISIENVKRGRKIGFPVHHILLGRESPILLLEDANLRVLESKEIEKVYLFPLRIKGVEASPVTAVAQIREKRS